MFSELKRNLRIVKAEKLFEAQLTDEMKKAVEENKFACICQKADKTEIAIKHFHKSLQILEQIGPVTNIYMNLANIEAQQKRHHEAIQLYKKTIELSPYSHEQQAPIIQFCPKLNSFNAYVDAHTNLACLLTNLDQHEEAYQYLMKAIQLQPDNQIAQTNFGDLLRQLGRQKEAIDHTWKQIEQISDQYQRPEPINAKLVEPQIFETVNVICMKWGTKYDHDYVNKLYHGILRYTKMPFNFICVTDNTEGLVEGIQTRELKKGWTGWWGKATLFMNYDYPEGKLVYIDLDMIITGDMAPIFQYNGPFAILKTDEIACEKLNKNGYNSSIMIWNNKIFERVFVELDKNWTNISKFIVRFDFWLEMMIENTDFLQDLYPGLIRDYVQDCKEQVPENTRIVCFPRTPKPHDYTSEWIKNYWVKN